MNGTTEKRSIPNHKSISRYTRLQDVTVSTNHRMFPRVLDKICCSPQAFIWFVRHSYSTMNHHFPANMLQKGLSKVIEKFGARPARHGAQFRTSIYSFFPECAGIMNKPMPIVNSWWIQVSILQFWRHSGANARFPAHFRARATIWVHRFQWSILQK